jgi:cell division protein FtsX
MNKPDPMAALNRPPFLIGGALVALVAGLAGWIQIEYAVICVGAAIVGLVLYYRKLHRTPADKHNE